VAANAGAEVRRPATSVPARTSRSTHNGRSEAAFGRLIEEVLIRASGAEGGTTFDGTVPPIFGAKRSPVLDAAPSALVDPVLPVSADPGLSFLVDFDHGHLLIWKSTVPLRKKRFFELLRSYTFTNYFSAAALSSTLSSMLRSGAELGRVRGESSVGCVQAHHPGTRALTCSRPDPTQCSTCDLVATAARRLGGQQRLHKSRDLFLVQPAAG
jgi:hypothetical protein